MIKYLRELTAIAAFVVAALLAFLSYAAPDSLTANMLILVAQFLVYSLTLFGFGTIANKLIKELRHEIK